MLWWLVVGTLCATTAALRLHQHTSSPEQCVDLQCPVMSFDYGRKKLVNEEKLSEEPCRNCQQCTAAGYSVCLKPRVLNRAKRQASLQEMSTCSCAHSVPANCHNELARTTHPANITMQLYNVCYASSLQAPAAALAKNLKKSVIVTVEPFWEEPYWKELDLENLTLTYNYNVKVPEHCDGDLETVETNGEAIHRCTAQLKIGMSTEDRTGEDDYEHSENATYDDDLPPEVDFDRDVFAGAKTVNFSYKVSLRRPRQLKIRPGSSDPFEDVGTVVESETLIHDMQPEIFGTGLEALDAKSQKHDKKEEKSEEKKEEKEETHDDTPNEGEQEEEQAISEEEGEAPENLPGTDFFSDDKSKDKEMTDEEKKQEEEEQKEEEIEEKEAEEIGEEERKEEEKEEKEEKQEKEEIEQKEKQEEEEKEKSADEKTKDEDGEEKKDKEEEMETAKDEEKDEKSKEEEKVPSEDDEEKKDEEKIDEKEEKEEKDEDEEKKNEENGSGSDEGDDDQGDETQEDKQWYQHVKDFFATEPRLNLARWVFIVTIVACTLLICTVCLRRRCMARNKRHQKTANGVRYEAAATSSLPQTGSDKNHGGHQLVSPERMHLNQ